MRLPNLPPAGEFFLLGLLTIAAAALIMRVVIFLQREFAQIPETYPSTWSGEQRLFLQRFRLSLGLPISALWLAGLMAEAVMPVSWPINAYQAIWVSVLLLMTSAWLLLFTRRDWGKLAGCGGSFPIIMGALVLWWAVVLSSSLWMLAKSVAANAPVFHSGPVIASHEVPCRVRLDDQLFRAAELFRVANAIGGLRVKLA